MKRRREDSGFAMLMVFLLSACVAITLYVEIPRVAFEAERQREMLLVDRGNQFKRAIQVFVHDRVNNPTGRYPSTIDELESFNGHRYLRRRYLDPMTGKDEWRLVHINGGVLTDSVTTTQAKPNQGASGGTTSTYLSQQTFLSDTGGSGNAGTGGVQRAMNRRPSDAEGAPGAPGAPGGGTGAPADGSGAGGSGTPPAAPPIPPGIPGIPGQPGTPQSGGQQQAQQPCNVYIGSCAPTTPSGQPGGQQPGQGGNGGNQGLPPGVPGGAGFGSGGAGGGAPAGGQTPQQSAADMINGLLTQPRPGGMPSNMPGSTIGGGLAGVASKYEAEGIMVINQRTKINEWEYIFDNSKWRAPPNPVAGTVGTPQPAMGSGTNNNNPPPGPGGTPGTNSGTGSGGLGKQ